MPPPDHQLAMPLSGRTYARPNTMPAEQVRPDDLIDHDGVTGTVDRVVVTHHGGTTTVRIYARSQLDEILNLVVAGGTPISRQVVRP